LILDNIACADVHSYLETLPEESVDLVVTSPPYWGLRDYGVEGQVWGGDPDCDHAWGEPLDHGNRGTRGGSGSDPKELAFAGTSSSGTVCATCGAWRGCLGLEPHPQQYITHLATIFDLIFKILKKTGSAYLNLGDTYYSSSGWNKPVSDETSTLEGGKMHRGPLSRRGHESNWLQPKQLLLIPSRVAVALQERGWILRNDIIWHKPNHMPSSVKDRLTNSYEHVYHFVKSKKYWYDLDAIRVPHKYLDQPPGNKIIEPTRTPAAQWNPSKRARPSRQQSFNPKGKNPGDTYHGKFSENETHEAFGSPRARTQRLKWANGSNAFGGDRGNRARTHDVKKLHRDGNGVYHPKGGNPGDFWNISTKPFREAHFATFPEALVERIVKSSCPEGGVVLDPFIGSGTTALVARKLNRHYLGCDLNQEYVDMANKRLMKIPERLERFIQKSGVLK
jgi:site-specific DNA-methyltransferase (cytosine-N4-specific)